MTRRMDVAIRAVLVVILLTATIMFSGCPPADGRDNWRDLMSGTVRGRTMLPENIVEVEFTDGGRFRSTVFELDNNMTAIQPGATYIVQCRLYCGPHYRFIQAGAESQIPQGVK